MTRYGTVLTGPVRRIARIAVAFAVIAAMFVVVSEAQGAPASGTVDFVLAISDAPEGTTPHSINVVLDVGATNNLDFDFSVDVTLVVAGGTTASDPADYAIAVNTVTFLAGDLDQTTRSVDISIVSDLLDEVDEIIDLELTNLQNTAGASTLGFTQQTHQVTITDDDAAPTISIDDDASTEGSPVTLDVNLSAPSSKTITVNYATSDDTATTGDSDYTADSNTLTFNPGDTTKTITIATGNDTKNEPDEDFNVTLTVPTNASILDGLGIGTINDNDGAPTVSIADDASPEGTTLTFDVTLSAASGQIVTVNYATSNGTATTADSDYTAKSGSVTFPVGDTSETVTIVTGTDTKDENNETIAVTLSNPSNTSITGGPATGTITDNDPAPSITIGDTSTTEGSSMSFGVSLSAVSGKTITVNYATSNGSATTADGDYTSDSDTLTFNPGDTIKNIVIATGDDSRDEPNETFNVSLTGETNSTLADATAEGTINDNDLPPDITISSVLVEEGATAGFTVELSAASGRQVTVSYATVNGTAIAPGDYTAHPSTQLVFTAGQTSKTVNVTTNDDSLDEAIEETFTITLSGATNATIPDPSGTGSIQDNDGAPGLSISEPAAQPEAAGMITFTVTLLPASGQIVTIDYATADGTATAGADYTAAAETLTFPAGETTMDIDVPITNDGFDEIAETFFVNLSNTTNAEAPIDPLATGTINDDDNVAPNASIQITDLAGNPTIEFGTGELVKVTINFTDPGIADTHTVTLDWGDLTAPDTFEISPIGARSFVRTHAYASENLYQVSASISDADGGTGSVTQTVGISGTSVGSVYKTGLVDTSQGRWYLYDGTGGLVTSFFYGNPRDYPFMGDWDGDGIETPGLYRQSDGFVYIKNTNAQGNADVSFFFGNPGDVPIAGDFNGDGSDTVSIYRPGNQRFYIINALGKNGGGLGAAEVVYTFGNPGDKPFVGDFDGDGMETVGLHRESTGRVYYINEHRSGNADNLFTFGNPGDRLIAGDWNGNGKFSPALFRPSQTKIFFKHTNTHGNADSEYRPSPANSTWLPVSGITGF